MRLFFETTGNDPVEDEVVSITLTDDFFTKAFLDQHVKPKRTHWDRQTTYITPDVVRDAPSLQDIIPKIKEIIQTQDEKVYVEDQKKADAFLFPLGIRFFSEEMISQKGEDDRQETDPEETEKVPAEREQAAVNAEPTKIPPVKTDKTPAGTEKRELQPGQIFGTARYQFIRNRHWTKLNTQSEVNAVAARLENMGIPYSGRMDAEGTGAMITVDTRYQDTMKHILAEIRHWKPYVTPEQVEEAKQIDLLTYLQRTSPSLLKRQGKEYRLEGYPHSFVISNGMWNDFNKNVGGKTALDFLIKMQGMSFQDAVTELTGAGWKGVEIPVIQPEEKKPFALPERAESNRRVWAYLSKRCINPNIIRECIHVGIIYESAEHHNCTFVGKDINGTARYAMQRGTLGSFKNEVESSEKDYGFCYGTGSSGRIYLCESPVDALSVASLLAGKDPNYRDHHYLSAAGVSGKAIRQYLKDHPDTKTLYFCFDNDAAGIKGMKQLQQELSAEGFSGKMILCPPPEGKGKDYNEYLISIHGKVQERAMQQQEPRGQG